MLTGQIEYEFKDGKKMGQTWSDAQGKVSRRVVNDYKNNTLIRETWGYPYGTASV